MKYYFLLLIMLLLPFAGAAEEKHVRLLAVSETDDGFKGSIADASLIIRPGTGKIFMDTLPLSKFDVQLSTRFAKEVACAYIEKDCSHYDFFYTIRADSPIIGGPSAGAAISALTVAVLDDLPISPDISLTGTINSGGYVGNVGGLINKIEAAADQGIKTVGIPKGSRYYHNTTGNETNSTIDLFAFGEEKGVAVKEIGGLGEAITLFTGKNYSIESADLAIDPSYAKIMSTLAHSLCNRSERLHGDVITALPKLTLLNITYSEELNTSLNLSLRGLSAIDEEKYYSAASYCYGANVGFISLVLSSKNLSEKSRAIFLEELNTSITNLDNNINKKGYRTIPELQTYMVVKERIAEAQRYVDETSALLNTTNSISGLALANERVFSALSWATFYSLNGTAYEFNEQEMKQTCVEKISEAQERVQYARLYIPDGLAGSIKELEDANLDLKKGAFASCIYTASITKAEANVVLNLLGAEEDQLPIIINEKQRLAQTVIAKAIAKGSFPIVGYSYYEYALSLKDYDPYSALLYLEYSLEISSIDMYFEPSNELAPPLLTKAQLSLPFAALIIISVLFGYALGVFTCQKKSMKKSKNKR